MKTKVCNKCGRELEATAKNFYRHAGHKDGLGSNCKRCKDKYSYQYRLTHPDVFRKQSRKYRQRYPERCRAQDRKHYRENIDARRAKSRKYYYKNREARIAYQKEWLKNNPEKRRAIGRRTQAKKCATPRGRLLNRVSSAIKRSLKNNKNGEHWETLVGYTLDDLKRHLERQFTEGMSWKRLMNGEIHIDHRIPISAFNFTDPSHPDFKRCWALSNLQPLWAQENLTKNAKLEEPHQPSLAMAGT